jgi:hypothetical protein
MVDRTCLQGPTSKTPTIHLSRMQSINTHAHVSLNIIPVYIYNYIYTYETHSNQENIYKII